MPKSPPTKDTYALGDDDDEANAEASDDNTATATGKWRPKQVPHEDLQQLIATRTCPAVIAALEALAAAPTSGGAKEKAKKGGRV